MAILTLFWHLNQHSLVTEDGFNKLVKQMSFAPTFKRGVTLVEKRCQLAQFIQDIVPFCFALCDGQHRLGITTALLDNICFDNFVPVNQENETYQFYSHSPINIPQKVIFMKSKQLSEETMKLFKAVGKRDVEMCELTFLYSPQDFLLHCHDSIISHNSADDVDWDWSEVSKKKKIFHLSQKKIS